MTTSSFAIEKSLFFFGKSKSCSICIRFHYFHEALKLFDKKLSRSWTKTSFCLVNQCTSILHYFGAKIVTISIEQKVFWKIGKWDFSIFFQTLCIWLYCSKKSCWKIHKVIQLLTTSSQLLKWFSRNNWWFLKNSSNNSFCNFLQNFCGFWIRWKLWT